MNKLAGKIAIVTGGSKGIGADIAKGLAKEGASVVVNYSSSKEGADKVVAEITSAGGKAVAVQGDVAKEADVNRLVDETKKEFGKLDVLVNNTGVCQFAPIEETTVDLAMLSMSRQLSYIELSLWLLSTVHLEEKL